MNSPHVNRIAAIAGAILLLVGTMLHPMTSDPNQALAAFTEYAADRPWVATHLTYTGFSELAMLINMPSSLFLLVWMMLVGIDPWRKTDLLSANASRD